MRIRRDYRWHVFLFLIEVFKGHFVIHYMHEIFKKPSKISKFAFKIHLISFHFNETPPFRKKYYFIETPLAPSSINSFPTKEKSIFNFSSHNLKPKTLIFTDRELAGQPQKAFEVQVESELYLHKENLSEKKIRESSHQNPFNYSNQTIHK